MFACALVIIFPLLYKCMLVYSITIYAISAYRVLSRCVLIGETMIQQEYNGWYNYETWLCKLHFDDVFAEEAQEIYDDAEPNDTFSKSETATLKLSEHIKDYVEEVTDIPENGFLADMVNAGLSEINYHEIAKNYVSELEA